MEQALQQYFPLIDQLAAEQPPHYSLALKSTTAGQQILSASGEEQRLYVLEMVSWLNQEKRRGVTRSWTVRSAMLELLKRKLPFTTGDVIALLNWSTRQDPNWNGAGQMITLLENYIN